jgi:hypothetical protein
VHAPAERAGTLPLFLLYPYMYSVVHTPLRIEWQNFEYPEKQLGKNLRKTFIWVDFTDVVPRYHARVVYVLYIFELAKKCIQRPPYLEHARQRRELSVCDRSLG